jgi:hypothetical protein
MPFTTQQFYDGFAAYNHAVWPAQYALFIFAAVAVYFAALPSRTYDRIASGMLAFLWVAAVSLGMPPDFGLTAIAVAALGIALGGRAARARFA